MSADTTIKKPRRSKKVVVDEGAADICINSTTQPVKKTRSRKAPTKAPEQLEIIESSSDTSKVVKSRDAKKTEDAKTTTKKATSKRAAKTSSIDLQLDSASSNASAILKEATAFSEKKHKAATLKEEAPAVSTTSEVLSKPDVEIVKVVSADSMRRSVSPETEEASAETSAAVLPESSEITPAASFKPSSFLNSFLNNPEPGPVPPPQGQQERTISPEEGRVELQQATRHDFEDSILTSRGNVKAASPPAPPPSAMPTTIEPPPSTPSSSQLRAFTTSSFAALRASSTSSAPTSKPPAAVQKPNPASKPPPPPPFKLPPSALPHSRIPPSKLPPPPNQRGPSSFSIKPPSPPSSKRPTEMSYKELNAHATYRSLRFRWTAFIVAVPFAIFSSYEIYRRWERGDFGKRVGEYSQGKLFSGLHRADEKREGGLRKEIGKEYDRMNGAGGGGLRVENGGKGLASVPGWGIGDGERERNVVGIAEPRDAVMVGSSSAPQDLGQSKTVAEVELSPFEEGRRQATTKKGWVQVFK